MDEEREPVSKAKPSKKQFCLILLTTLTVVTAIAVAVVITLYCFKSKHHYHGKPKSSANAELYQNAAVATDASSCSEIGRDILGRNGSAVDAAVATSFCLGLFSMHSTGIGGGGLMVVYQRKTKTMESFDYRETAPGKSREDMFQNEPEKSKSGGLSIGVPGEVKGLYEIHKKYGILPWKELIQPTIDLAESGFHMTLRMYEAAESLRHKLKKDEGLKKLLFENGAVLELGSTIIDKSLASTLRKIAEDPNDFYNGSLAENIVSDVRAKGGIISLDDLANYKVMQRKLIETDLGDYTMHAMPSPTGGPIVSHILNIIKGYGLSAEDLASPSAEIKTYHRIIEAFKFAFGEKTKESDPEFMDKEKLEKWEENMTSTHIGTQVRLQITDDTTHNISYYGVNIDPPTDHGTTHVSIYAPNGDAVSFTSSINDWYGAAYRSKNTGIIYNNGMDDFSTPGQNSRFGYPPTESNYIKPNKRAVSSMTPIIITDKNGNVKLVIGASGGPKIITAVAQGIIFKLLCNDELGLSIIRPRVHHQLIPNIVGGEVRRSLDAVVLKGLEKLKHEIKLIDMPEYSAIQAIFVDGKNKVYAKSDPRKYGHSAGF